MIKFEDVTKAYLGQILLESVSFKLNPGEKCGIVGRNGSGKTTLLRLITKEETSDKGLIELPKNYSLGYLSQHLSFTKPSLIEEAACSLKNPDHLYLIEKILFGLGFNENDLNQPPSKFSGGYQLRIHLAKVLAAEPHCLLLDEPTNYLDVVSIRWLTRFLKQWKGEFLLISHDRDFMDSVTTHTLGIHRQKVLKVNGGTQDYYTQILQQEEIYEKTRVNLEKKRSHMQAFVTKLGAKASKASQAQSRLKMLAKMPVLEELASLYQLDFSFPYSPFPGQRFVEAQNIIFSYPSMLLPLIENFTLTIEKEERIAIVGKNGRGKSTLLRLLAMDLTPSSGKCVISPNVNIGYFGQTNIDRLHPEMTVEEEIASSAPLPISEVRRICGLMMFSSDLAKKKIKVLSGGEKSRVLLGKILAKPSNLLLLDEPTNHLDMESIEALINAIQEFPGAVVIVTHSELILKQLPEKFVICKEGSQSIFEGNYDLFLEKLGWETEESKGVSKPNSQKDIKRKRAELVQTRSKLLLPIQKQIEYLEKEIIYLEKEVEKDLEALVSASSLQNSEQIVLLSKHIDEKKKKIEHFFEELEEQFALYEEKKREIEKMYHE